MTVPATTADTQDSPLLAAVVDRLRTRVKGLTQANCFATDQPVPPDAYFSQGDVACTVCLLDGTFDEQLWNGGGPNQLRETPRLGVTILRRTNIDQPPRLTSGLQDSSKGILKVWKLELLRALLVEDAAADVLVPWQPVDDEGLPILRGMGLLPRRSEGPRPLVGGEWLGLTLWFEVSFDWDLRQPEVSA